MKFIILYLLSIGFSNVWGLAKREQVKQILIIYFAIFCLFAGHVCKNFQSWVVMKGRMWWNSIPKGIWTFCQSWTCSADLPGYWYTAESLYCKGSLPQEWRNIRPYRNVQILQSGIDSQTGIWKRNSTWVSNICPLGL